MCVCVFIYGCKCIWVLYHRYRRCIPFICFAIFAVCVCVCVLVNGQWFLDVIALNCFPPSPFGCCDWRADICRIWKVEGGRRKEEEVGWGGFREVGWAADNGGVLAVAVMGAYYIQWPLSANLNNKKVKCSPGLVYRSRDSLTQPPACDYWLFIHFLFHFVWPAVVVVVVVVAAAAAVVLFQNCPYIYTHTYIHIDKSIW